MTYEVPEPERFRGPGGRPGGPALRRRPRALLPTVLVLLALLVAFTVFTNFYTDLLWFRSVGYGSVYWRELRVKVLLFVVGGLVMAVAVAVNVVVAYRTRPAYSPLVPGQAELDRYRMAIEPFRRLLVAGAMVLLGLVAGSSAAGEWRTYVQWRNGTSFGSKDPQFGIDIGFFTFDLPWYRFLLGFAIAAVVLSLIAAAVTHYLYGGLRLQALMGERATPAARVHLSVLLGVFVLLKSVGYWLDRYSLAVQSTRVGRSEITGLRYTDVNAVLFGKNFLVVVALICAGLFFANIVRRTWLLPGLGIGLLLLSALLVGGIYPAIVQRLQVRPSEADREAPYISRNIEATRQAYGIDGVQISDYSAQTTARPAQLRGDADTTASVRLLDPAVLGPTFKNLQQIRSYYDFANTLSVDRYTINGQRRDVVVAVREVDLVGLPSAQRNWLNDHTVYTHGIGVVAALGNTYDSAGRPSFVSSGIPPTGQLGDYEPRIYFGRTSPTYSVVGGPRGAPPVELDFPDNTETGQRNNTYAGKGGVGMGSLFRRVLYATKYREANILLSGRINEQSRILYNRQPKERVKKVAPWLTLDGDPYPAVVDGRILWIVDGYTTTNGFPYSSRTTLDAVTETSQTTTTTQVVTPVDRINYIRNSVKATVDAYDGTVTLYEWDQQDPVLETWRRVFPGTVKPRSDISPELLAHLRYPEDLFKVQRTLLARYHVEDPQAFYNGGDFWRVPQDPTQPTQSDAQPPYYLTLRMPGQDRATFSLTSTFVPAGNRENLSAFVAVNADPGPDYGTFRVLQLPRSVQIPGPAQVQNTFNTNADVAEQINLLRRGDSDVVYGNLLTLPVGGGLLYVEPVYVKASATTAFPLLRKVLVAFGDRVGFEDTLQEALDSVFAGQSGVGPPPAGGGGTPTPTPTPSGTASPPAAGGAALAQALADAEKALQDSDAALRRGDFAGYGEAQRRLQDAISRAVAAQGGLTATPSPGGSPSPSPLG